LSIGSGRTALSDLLQKVSPRLDVEALLAGGRSPHTLSARLQDAQALASFLHDEGRTIADLDALTAIRFRDWCAARFSPATVNRRIATLRLIVGRFHAAGLMDSDPCVDLRGFDLGDGGATPALTRAQAQDLVATTDDDATPRGIRDRALIRLGLRTGLRSAEILRLAPGDVAQVEGHAIAQVTVKGRKRLRIKISSVLDDLNAWRDLAVELALTSLAPGDPYAVGVVGPWRNAGPAGRWFLSPAPIAASTLANMIQRRGAMAGIPFKVTPHVLRATFITLTLHAGAPLHRVQRSAGHSDPRTTLRYDARRDDLEDHPSDYLAGI
jgi:integrase/recombinase XerD